MAAERFWPPPLARSRRVPPRGPLWGGPLPLDWGWIAAGTTVTRHYVGRQPAVLLWYERDAANMARYRWQPIARDWVADEWDASENELALLLCFLLGIGILLLAYLIVRKPPAVLTVTYAHF